ncbi:MAG TPA: isoprenylcysteine carboxylmethyltransferase family protein [Acidobacteriota bacterium]|jgi:protein-S-isoprenylcysteine O-methyltransferase Ste14
MGFDYAAILQRVRVPIRTVWVAFFLVFSRPTADLVLAGLAVSVAGLWIRIWAAGCIEKSRELEMRGPYRYTRNPLYLGSFLVGLGGSIASGNPWLLLSFVAIFVMVYGPVMRREEQELMKLFPEHFPAYRRSVPLFLPRFRAARMNTRTSPGTETAPPSGERRFRWFRVTRNREYNSILGFAAVFGWILFRLWAS